MSATPRPTLMTCRRFWEGRHTTHTLGTERRNAATRRSDSAAGARSPRSVAHERPGGGRSRVLLLVQGLLLAQVGPRRSARRLGRRREARGFTAAGRRHRGSISEEARGELWHSPHSSPARVGPGRGKELSKLSKQGASARRAGRGNACSRATWPARSPSRRRAGHPGVRVVWCVLLEAAATVRTTGRWGRRPRRPWTRTRTRSGPGWPGWSASCRPSSRRARRRAS